MRGQDFGTSPAVHPPLWENMAMKVTKLTELEALEVENLRLREQLAVERLERVRDQKDALNARLVIKYGLEDMSNQFSPDGKQILSTTAAEKVSALGKRISTDQTGKKTPMQEMTGGGGDGKNKERKE